MSIHTQAKLARTTERYHLLLALFLLFTGLSAGVHALEYYYHRSDYALINALHNGLGISQILVLALMVLHVLLMNKQAKAARICKRTVFFGSFVEKTNFLAMAGSWFFTWIMNMLISEWTEPNVLGYGPHDPASLFPPTYYLQLLLACMLVSYSLLFFLFYAVAGSGGDEA